jgi:hypothetical protein
MKRLLACIGLRAAFSISVWAQSEAKLRVDRDGDFHFRSRVVFGEKTLQRGMYRINRIAVNGNDYVALRTVTMSSPLRSMGPAWVSKEIARIRCGVRDRKVVNRRSELILFRLDGQWRLAEVRFKNESSACVLQ